MKLLPTPPVFLNIGFSGNKQKEDSRCTTFNCTALFPGAGFEPAFLVIEVSLFFATQKPF